MTDAQFDFEQVPFTVIWEVTRACSLRCVHCRADACAVRDPAELTTEEGRALLDQIAELGSPIFVITGGDPLERPDLFELIDHANQRGLSVALTPSGTPRLDRRAVERIAASGVKRVALSIDAADESAHDEFRRQPGSFRYTVDAARRLTALGMPLQINTTVTRRNAGQLLALADLVGDVGAVMWSVFFLIHVGRGRAEEALSAQQHELVFERLHEISQRSSFQVRTTAAPHYRRFVLQRRTAQRRSGQRVSVPMPFGGTLAGLPRPNRGVTDGCGLVFVSHVGDVQPSGFLPLRAGNIRELSLSDIYRHSPLFKALRNPDAFHGKCGYCEFRRVCGGSRARAYAATGDYLQADPSCAWIPGSAEHQLGAP